MEQNDEKMNQHVDELHVRGEKDELILSAPGQLSLPDEAEFENVCELTVKGVASSTDLEFLGSIARTYGNLRVLDLRAVTGVDKITRRAFIDCESFKNVLLPDCIQIIEESAFEGCENLSSINLPSSLQKIGDKTFAHCIHLSSIKFPNGLLVIGKKAFRDCDSISTLDIPASVTEIGDLAFTYNVHLSEINVSRGNKNYLSDDGVLFGKDGSVLIQFPQGKSQNQFKIPNGVTRICDRAFVHCDSLKKIKMPETLTEIGNEAFYYCSNLESMELPASLKKMGKSIFRECNNLENIQVQASNVSFDSRDGVLYTKDEKELLAYPNGKDKSKFEIPANIATVAEDAFAGNMFIESLSIPDTISDASASFFAQFKGLKEIRMSHEIEAPFGFELSSNNKGLFVYKLKDSGLWNTIKSFFS